MRLGLAPLAVRINAAQVVALSSGLAGFTSTSQPKPVRRVACERLETRMVAAAFDPDKAYR